MSALERLGPSSVGLPCLRVWPRWVDAATLVGSKHLPYRPSSHAVNFLGCVVAAYFCLSVS